MNGLGQAWVGARTESALTRVLPLLLYQIANGPRIPSRRRISVHFTGHLLTRMQYTRMIAASEQRPDVRERKPRVLTQEIHREMAWRNDFFMPGCSANLLDADAKMTGHGVQNRLRIVAHFYRRYQIGKCF